MLAAARRRRGWSQREAARNAGVAYGMIGHLEHCRRAPSTVLAEKIIAFYQLDSAEAVMLRAEAVEGAGRDSPFRRAAPAPGRLLWEPGLAALSMGARRPSRSWAW